MKRIIILCFVVIATISAYGQTALQEGNDCFEKGNYDCAVAKYNEALKSATGAHREILSINLRNAQKCVDEKIVADKAFDSKNYVTAKQSYQNVLDLNPKDTYAKTQIEECNKLFIPPTTLTVSKESLSFSPSGGTEYITVLTNANSYSVSGLPSWTTVRKNTNNFTVECTANSSNSTRADYFVVTAGDKTVRVNISQAGKTTSVTTFSTSTQNLFFNSNGGRAIIDVKINGSGYQVTSLPAWCKVGVKRSGWFSLVCDVNNSYQPRSDYFIVRAGGKEVKIYVNQEGRGSTTTQGSNKATIANKSVYSKSRKCFNCPKTKYTWGLTAGYTQLAYSPYERLMYDPYVQTTTQNSYWDGLQLGLRIEPLFKYGFGFNTGIFYEYYSQSVTYEDGYGYSYDETQSVQAFSIPLHLEYRLNFSNSFSVFAYGGAGLNLVTYSTAENHTFPTTLEYGAGLRINRIQFNTGKSSYVGDFRNMHSFGNDIRPYHNLVFSMSYMF